MTEQRPKPKQDERTGRFLSGNIGGPGRPKGSRNKLGEAFIDDLYADWLEHGAATIRQVREERPQDYLKVAAGLLPKELKIERSDDLTDEQLDARIHQLAEIIGVEIRIGGAAGGETKTPQPQSASGLPTIQ